MRVEILQSALKDLKAINQPMRGTIFGKIEKLEAFPNVSNIKKLTNFEPTHRLRVGDYRVLFDVEGEIILVGRVLHRSKSYQ